MILSSLESVFKENGAKRGYTFEYVCGFSLSMLTRKRSDNLPIFEGFLKGYGFKARW